MQADGEFVELLIISEGGVTFTVASTWSIAIIKQKKNEKMKKKNDIIICEILEINPEIVCCYLFKHTLQVFSKWRIFINYEFCHICIV